MPTMIKDRTREVGAPPTSVGKVPAQRRRRPAVGARLDAGFGYQGGPIIQNPDVYVSFWGASWSGPANAQRRTDKMGRGVRVFRCLLSGVFLCAFEPGLAQAATLSVNCNGSGDNQPTSISKALTFVNHKGPNTINVSGSCHENVLIQGFENLTLNAVSGASITDASGGAGNVVDIEDSTDVTLQGFTITGGDIGVFCGDVSVCRFKNNTIQNATDAVSGDGYGVQIGGGSRATLDGDVIQNNAERGLMVFNGSSANGVGIQVNNNGIGIFIGVGSNFVGNATSQNNVLGVSVNRHSTFTLFSGAISGNKGQGVSVQGSSEASIQSFVGPITISNNGGDGVQIHDFSFAVFTNGGTALNVTGNAAQDVDCLQFPFAARGVTTDIGSGKTTTCTKEPL